MTSENDRLNEALAVVDNLVSDNPAQVVGAGYARVLAAEVRRLSALREAEREVNINIGIRVASSWLFDNGHPDLAGDVHRLAAESVAGTGE